MAFREPDFVSEVALCFAIHKWKTPSEVTAETTDIVAALGADTATHDTTIEAATDARLRLGPTNAIVAPAAGWKTRFGNDLILLINQGRAGGLSKGQIIGAIDDAAGVLHAPALIDIPFLSGVPPYANGSVLTCTSGNWTGSPTGYTYQFRRDGTNFGSATSTATYTIVSANDSGHQIDCVVVATNATGSNTAPASNAVRVP